MSVNTASYADLLVMIAALKEENERLKEEFKMSEYSANLANICREEWKTTAIEYSHEVVALKARVAELEEHEKIYIKVLRVADVALKTVRRKEPANEG